MQFAGVQKEPEIRVSQCGKQCQQMKEEVLVKYKVEVSNRGAYKGRGEPSEWRMVQRVNKNINLGSG